MKRKRIASFIRQDSPVRSVSDEPVKKPSLMSTIVTSTTGNSSKVKPIRSCVSYENENKSGSGDRIGLERNRRMFGMIMGTLQKFQTEETRRSNVTQKREEIEKKLEHEAEVEQASVRKEKTQLFRELRHKQSIERKLQHKIERVECHELWEKSVQPLTSFIQTRAKPCLFYLPKVMTPESEKRLKDTKDKYRLIIAEQRAKLQKDLDEIEELYRRELDDETVMITDADSSSTVAAEKRLLGQSEEDVEVNDQETGSGEQKENEMVQNILDDQEEEEEEDDEASSPHHSDPHDSLANKDFEPNYDE